MFEEGQSLFVYPLKMVFVPLADTASENFLFGVSVPKRIHRKAAVRNLLKRRIREAFRTNKPWIVKHSPQDLKFAVLYLYLAKDVEDYHAIERAVKTLNKKWIKSMKSAKDQ